MDSEQQPAVTAADGEHVPPSPVKAGDRLVTLDFIRGLAVMGILFSNITSFAHPTLAYNWPGALPAGGNVADGWVWLFQFVVVDGKFRGLFSLLFGVGICLFSERLWARGDDETFQMRRLFWLLIFGLLHFVLLYTGDILVLYAVSGFIALTMVHWSAKRQLWGGVAAYIAGSLLMSAALASPAILEMSASLTGQSAIRWDELVASRQSAVADAELETAVMRHAGYWGIIAHRLAEHWGAVAQVPFLAAVETVPLMLIGMGLYRMGFFVPGRQGRLWAAPLALGFGAVVSLLLGWWVMAEHFPPYLTDLVFFGLAAFPHLPMVLGAAALLVWMTPRVQDSWLGGRVIAAGRMAFSNYIGTSLVMMLVFQGWAGNRFGELHRMDLLLYVAMGCLLMLWWSEPWLRRFWQGPLEWLWRCLGYSRWLPNRR